MIAALNVFYDARTEKSKNCSNRERIVLYSEEIKRSMFTRVLRLRQWHFHIFTRVKRFGTCCCCRCYCCCSAN